MPCRHASSSNKAKPEMGRHLGIRQGAVKHPVIGQAPVLHQGTQLAIRASGNRRPTAAGAGELPGGIAPAIAPSSASRKRLSKEALWATRIVITDKVDEIRHHLSPGGLFQHGIADPGILLDEAAQC